MLIAALFAAVGIVTLIATFWERRRHRRIAQRRAAVSKSEFQDRLQLAGVSSEVAEFVWSEVQPYYFKPLTPDPSDRWESTMRIDPQDLRDISERFWRKQDWEDPTLDNPARLPRDPSLLEYALWLESQGAMH